MIDESGEDYLFAADRLIAIEVPAAVRHSVSKTSEPSRRFRTDAPNSHFAEALAQLNPSLRSVGASRD